MSRARIFIFFIFSGPFSQILKLKDQCETYVLDLIDAHIQACGAPAHHSVLAVYSQLVHGYVYDGAIIYKLYVIMYLSFGCNLHSTE